MKKLLICGFLSVAMHLKSHGQFTTVYGYVKDKTTRQPISNVNIRVQGTQIEVQSNALGYFKFVLSLDGDFILTFSHEMYVTQELLVKRAGNNADLGNHFLQKKNEVIGELSIPITEGDLFDLEGQDISYTTGILQSSMDEFQRAAAFNFSQAWFKVRGYDSRHKLITLNGTELNKLYDGRPNWSNWGGLNDVFRNNDIVYGIQQSTRLFGGLGGSIDMKTYAGDYRPELKISYARANKSYKSRLMWKYSSGMNRKNWAIVLSGSRRFSNSGFLNGTPYKAHSGFLSLEKKLNNRNRFNLTLIAASNSRGKSSPNTKEIIAVKGEKYNSYWGLQNDNIRNSRVKKVFEPIIQMSHSYKRRRFLLENSISIQKGSVKNSRLAYQNTSNPAPDYWQSLPSYFLSRHPVNYEVVFHSLEELKENGQINWNDLYTVNLNNRTSKYIVQNDVTRDHSTQFNSYLSLDNKDTGKILASLTYQRVRSENFAEISDLLGGEIYLDINSFEEGSASQNDLNNPDKMVKSGDKFSYNYDILSSKSHLFIQYQNELKKWHYFISLGYNTKDIIRIGHYKNGEYPDDSFGDGSRNQFSSYCFKLGSTFKFNGRKNMSVNIARLGNSPYTRDIYQNIRLNNRINSHLKNEVIYSGDISLNYRFPHYRFRVTGYMTEFRNSIESSFYFGEDLKNGVSDFVNEYVYEINKRHVGVELGGSMDVISGFRINFAGNYGVYQYVNDPKINISSAYFNDKLGDLGKSNLKYYRVSGTPQVAFSGGFEYKDPNYWWIQSAVNFIDDNYIDVSPIRRTENFYLDDNNVPFNRWQSSDTLSSEDLDQLLKQERFPSVLLLNLAAGKSWKINNYYTGFFIAVNNILGKVFKTGGFEQSRKTRYPSYFEDNTRDYPIFGPKYWYGGKTSFYLNFYVKI